jgi:hypothetical protein
MQIMLKELPLQKQLQMFKTVLMRLIHPRHERCLFAKYIVWGSLQKELASIDENVRRKSVPGPTLLRILLLK